MRALLAIIMVAIAYNAKADTFADAAAHWATIPAIDQPYVRLLSTGHLPPEQEKNCIIAMQLVLVQTSRQPVIERCTAKQVAAHLYRIDLRDLKWRVEDWVHVVDGYPYSRLANPNLVRADWLVLKLSDASESDAYYRLLFGGDQIPEKRDDWLKLLGVSTTAGIDDPNYRNFGLVEGSSGVAKNLIRWLESRPIARGYAWGTRDTLDLETENDPLEHVDGNYKHDGEEWIVGLPKVSIATGQRGAVQLYLLSDGAGNRVDKAPVDLVEDSTRFRGFREIRTPGSCIQCHDSGLNDFTRNELRELIADGVEVTTYDKEQSAKIEAFHLSDVSKSIARANEDFAVPIELACGCTTIEAAAAFKATIDYYDAPLALEATARELYIDPDAWQSSLVKANNRGARLGARMSAVAHGQTIPRDAWESRYLEARSYWQEYPNE